MIRSARCRCGRPRRRAAATCDGCADWPSSRRPPAPRPFPRSWLPVPGWDTRYPAERRGNFWNYDEVSWGLTECQRRGCSAPAELLADGLPLCIECAELLLERQAALVLSPRLAALLPDWAEA